MLTLSRLSCIGEALRDGTFTFPTNTALIEVDRHRENVRYTYRQLRAEAERVAGHIEAHGFKPGDRAAVLMSNQSKWAISALGAFWAGAVLVPLDYKLTAEEQLALLVHAKPQVLFVEYPVWRLLLKLDLSRALAYVRPRPCFTCSCGGQMHVVRTRLRPPAARSAPIDDAAVVIAM